VKAAQDEARPAASRRKTQIRRNFFSQSARACFSGIFQVLTTRAAPALAMAVQRLWQLLGSSPKAPRTYFAKSPLKKGEELVRNFRQRRRLLINVA
jgi:hypothetical protein